MKITRPSKENNENELERLAIIANEGCDKCPECGYPNNPAPINRIWHDYRKGWLKVTRYICKKCGCEYQSEPFKIWNE
jgi:transposase-like protein